YRHLRTMLLDNPPDGLVAAVAAMKGREDSMSLLSSVTVPTLVIAGTEDVLIPADTTRGLARGIPGARFETIPGAGHVAPLEASEPAVGIIRSFLESIS